MSKHFKKGHKPSSDHIPFKKILIFVGLIFLTGLIYLSQNFGDYFMGSIVGQPTTLLSGYACPKSSLAYEVSPIPDLFSYKKGDVEFNRKEILRINKKNHGLTSWFSYDKGFNEAAKVKLIDIMAYEKNPQKWLSRIYDEIKNDKSPHGAVDLVTRWLSPDNPNLSTVYPYSTGLVVDAVEGSSGYGNYVSVCTDVIAPNGVTLRLLYNVGHLQSLSVSEGQSISAGTELGKIGSSGNSSTPHAHIAIHPDFVWVSNYKDVYNAGYKFYYSTSPVESLEKMIDPLAVFLNPKLAYSVVMDDTKRQAFFSNPTRYIAGNGSAVVFAGDLPDASLASIIPDPKPVFSGFSLSSTADKAKIGDWVTISVEAIDSEKNRYTDFSGDISVVLSSSTASFNGVKKMSQGLTSFQVTDSVPGELIVQVSNLGTISQEYKLIFSDNLKFLEVTSPQKTTVNKSVVVVLRPIGTYGNVLIDQVNVLVSVFPAVQKQGALTIVDGRAEYIFQSSDEGVYELSFSTQSGVTEKIFITVENPVTNLVKEVNSDTKTEKEMEKDVVIDDVSDVPDESKDSKDSSESADISTEHEKNTENSPKTKDVISDIPEKKVQKVTVSPTALSDADIVLLERDGYHIYDVDGKPFIVFDDSSVESEYPVEMRFTVPPGTEFVSIFTGLNDRSFPDTGELKLTKYTPGQKYIRYYPKYVPEDSYKKIVAYSNDSVLAELVFTWSPASTHLFTDVIDVVTDPEIYRSIRTLKDAGVVKGNPDGSYGLDKPINRASVATLLIRAFYSDIDLDSLDISSSPFSDVLPNTWYAPALWFASQDSYSGKTKPVIVKGYDGKANPDGNVKIEEFVTMILRLLEIPVQESAVWYEAYVTKAIGLGLMNEGERSFIDQPLHRDVVARILVKAIELSKTLPSSNNIQDVYPGLSVDDSVKSSPKAGDQVLESSTSPVDMNLPVVRNITSSFKDSKLKLTWESSIDGSFQVFRETSGGSGEIMIGTTKGKSFVDVTAEVGKSYYYRVELVGSPVQNAKIFVQL